MPRAAGSRRASARRWSAWSPERSAGSAAERSLDELARPGRRPRAPRSCFACCRSGRSPIRRRSSASGKIEDAGGVVRRDARRRRRLRQRADAGAAAADRERSRPQDHRSHAAHPRHLRAPGADARRQAAGRAGAAEIPAAAARRRRARRCRGWAAASARRGPGETKLETDRRRIRTRIHAVGEDIEQVRQRRAQLRERRHKASVPTVALVGYTNAGKTTLFNVLTRAGAEASNALFVTLDPLVRQVRLPDSRELLVSDTVGFIDRLPHALVAAFRATLEEVAEADLILHVIDAVGAGPRPADGRRAAGARGGRRHRCAADRGVQQVRCADGRRAAAAAGPGSGGAVHLGARPATGSTSWSTP